VKIVLYVIAVFLGLVGLVFIVGHQGNVMRVVIGLILLGAAVAMVWMARVKVPEPAVHITQHIDVPGDSEMEQLKCNNCGAPLDKESVSLKEGAIFVACPYCNTSYQIEEAPKW
jgi:hypothetical protein